MCLVPRVLAQDGTRPLAAAGDWTAAAAHAALYDPHPDRLHEATQTRIIALTLSGDYDSALALLDTTPPAPQEHAVAAALGAHLAARAGHPLHDHLTRLLTTLDNATQQTDGADPASLFRIRLAQTADDLGANSAATGRLWQQLVDEVLQTRDAYAAREASKALAVISPDRAGALTDLTHRAALAPQGPPINLLAGLASLAAPLRLAAASSLAHWPTEHPDRRHDHENRRQLCASPGSRRDLAATVVFKHRLRNIHGVRAAGHQGCAVGVVRRRPDTGASCRRRASSAAGRGGRYGSCRVRGDRAMGPEPATAPSRANRRTATVQGDTAVDLAAFDDLKFQDDLHRARLRGLDSAPSMVDNAVLPIRHRSAELIATAADTGQRSAVPPS